MRFLSIYKNSRDGGMPSQEEMERMGKLVDEWMRSGILLAAEGCMPSSTGARLRLTNGNISVTDGPFTETKEVVGGLAILQANSKDEAIEHIKKFLEFAGEGECELRQLYDGPPPA